MTDDSNSVHQSAATVLAVSITGSEVSSGWGKARTVAIATVADGEVTSWDVHQVDWDVAHEQGTEGAHHARIVRFIREHDVQVIVTGHLGAPMHRTLTKLGCKVVLGMTGDARSAAVIAVDAPPSAPGAGGGHDHHHHVTIAPADHT